VGDLRIYGFATTENPGFPPQKNTPPTTRNKGLMPIGSMYGTFTYIWLKFIVNVGKYTIHGSYGIRLYNKA